MIPSRHRSWSFGTHRRLTRSKDRVMPPSTSQVKVIYLPGIGETRVITLPSMRNVEGHSWMTHIFTILLFSAFSLAGSELPLHYGHVSPFFGIFVYFIGSCGTKHLLYVSILISTAIFLGGTATSRPNRWRAMSFPPLHSQFVCSWLQKVHGLRHQGQSMYQLCQVTIRPLFIVNRCAA